MQYRDLEKTGLIECIPEDHLSDDLQQVAARLSAVYPLPDRLNDSVRASADAALEGLAIVHYQGEHRVPLRRSTVDWVSSPGIRSQNEHFVFRTSFVGDLAKAWHVFRLPVRHSRLAVRVHRVPA